MQFKGLKLFPSKNINVIISKDKVDQTKLIWKIYRHNVGIVGRLFISFDRWLENHTMKASKDLKGLES